MATHEGYSQYQQGYAGIPTRAAIYIRKQMFAALMELARPTQATKVLDVGATGEERDGTNFFEANYPYPQSITATGVEDASYLEAKYPGVKFVLADARALPFGGHSFDLVVAAALIEHVGSREQQREVVREFCRVGKEVCLTTPNRYFPIEFHTVVPFAHWLPPKLFHKVLRRLGRDFYASEERLNLLAERDLRSLVPPGRTAIVKRFKLLGLTSNLVLYIR